VTWTDPAAAIPLFQTGDIFTEPNHKTYTIDNLLSVYHAVGSREYVEKGVQNSTTETSLYTTQPLIPGGTMGTVGSYTALLFGRMAQATTPTLLWTWRIKLGGSTVYTLSATGGNAVDTEGLWWLEIYIENMGSQSSQRIWGRGYKYPTGQATFPFTLSATSTVDTSVDQVFDITVQMGAAGANNYCYKTFSKQTAGKN